MKPKYLFILSVLAGLLAVVLVKFQLMQGEGAALKVFRATADIKIGESIGERTEVVALPSNYYPNILKEAPGEDMEELVRTTPVRLPIERGAIILYRHLDKSVDPGVRELIPQDKRAVSIKVDETTSVSYLVEPGDQVDIWTVRGEPDGDPVKSKVEILLENVTVLAVGNQVRSGPSSRRSRQSYSSVTLLLGQEEAEKLIRARDLDRLPLTLLLRGLEEDPAQASSR